MIKLRNFLNEEFLYDEMYDTKSEQYIVQKKF